jgi:simple sugar transport system ATP-binding protein
MADTPVLRAEGIVKRFGHVEALRGVDLEVSAGEVVGLVGDNGAGKSTLIKALSGTLEPDGGRIFVEGAPTRIGSPAEARALGIETVYQDLALAPDLDAVANLFLGREQVSSGWRGRLGTLRQRSMNAEAPRILEALGVRLPRLDAPMSTMSGGQRQIVAVARALTWATRVVFMDEPTAALGVAQTEQVAELVRMTSRRGVAVVMISHNLPELLQVVDRVEVLRLGRVAASFDVEEATTSALVAAMTGLDVPAGA